MTYVYRWRLNNADIVIPEEEESPYSLMGGDLIISYPDRSRDIGNYTCVATNEFGAVISQTASVQFGCEFIYITALLIFNNI